MTTRRVLRSSAKELGSTSRLPLPISPVTPVPPTTVVSPILLVAASSSSSAPNIEIIPHGSKLPGLSASELKLLRQKQEKLSATAIETLTSLPSSHGKQFQNALLSTLIFAQYDAGTAVCVDERGWVLTCAHCFADDIEAYEELGSKGKRRWMLFYEGTAVRVECRVWDGRLDLALCQIIALELELEQTPDSRLLLCSGPRQGPNFHFLPSSSSSSSSEVHVLVGGGEEAILCIGQPGRDDLEATTEGRKTMYKLVKVSEGKFRGLVEGRDPRDNEEIGTLMHDAWTYWGHSGAPLVGMSGGSAGKLVGLHSSWDDETGMRHGVPGGVIGEFLGKTLGEGGGLGG